MHFKCLQDDKDLPLWLSNGVKKFPISSVWKWKLLSVVGWVEESMFNFIFHNAETFTVSSYVIFKQGFLGIGGKNYKRQITS